MDSRESKEVKLPLGWYMSDIVSKEIDQRVKDIPDIDTTATPILKQWFLSNSALLSENGLPE